MANAAGPFSHGVDMNEHLDQKAGNVAVKQTEDRESVDRKDTFAEYSAEVAQDPIKALKALFSKPKTT